MKPAKFIVLVICTLIGMLSIPHVTLWSFTVGVEKASADKYYQSESLNIGSNCESSLEDKQRCAWRSDDTNPFVIVKCTKHATYDPNFPGRVVSYYYTWDLPPASQLITRPDYNSCKSSCPSCIEPYSDVTRTPNTNVAPGQTSVAVTSTATYPGDIQSHTIKFEITNPDGTPGGAYSTPCNSEKTCPSSNTFAGYTPGATVKYWSDVVLADGTYIKNPQTTPYSFILSASGTTPPTPTPTTCGGQSKPTTPPCPTGQTYQCVNSAWACTGTPAPGTQRLTVIKAGDGTVTSIPTGINCGSTCLFDFSQNTQVTLTANPSTGQFTDGCSGTGTCPVTMSAAKTVIATFTGGTPGTGTTDGTGNIQVTQTTTTATGGNVAIRFIAPSTVTSVNYQLFGPTTTSGSIPCSVVVTNGKSCLTSLPLTAGNYQITASDNTGNPITLNPTPFTFTVAASGTGSGTGHCCVKKTGSSYTYENINPSESTQCAESGGTYRSEACINAQNFACAQYCLDGGLGNNGRCDNLGNPTSPYYGICLNPTATPCVCTGTPSNSNLPCESLCNSDSRVISVVNSAYSAQQIISANCQCTTNPSATNVMVQLPSAGSASNRQPIQLGTAGQNGCTTPQACWATFMTLASYSATTQTAATLPGTQTAGSWTHPNDITASAPRATPNEYDCTLAGNATITASLGIAGTNQTSGISSTSVTRLIQAGETVTITGQVSKMANTCKGYKYTCIRMSQKMACESHNRGLWTSFDYKTCPSDLPEDTWHEGADGIKMNWKLMVTAALIAASFISGGGALAPLISVLKGMQSSLYLTAAIATTENLNCRPGTSQSGTQQAIAQGTSLAFQLAQCAGGTTAAAVTAAGGTAAAGAVDGQVNCAQYIGAPACVDPRCAWSSSTMTCVPAGQTPPSGTTGVGAGTSCLTGQSCVSPNNCASSEGPCENGKVCCWDFFVNGAATAKPTFDVTGDATANPAPGITGMAGCNPAQFTNLGSAGVLMALNALPTCPSADDYMNCFSVCGKTYETAVAAAPLCNQGGPVIGFTAATYPCATGTCGAYASKRVKIDIRGPDGSQAIEDYVTTDSTGAFSYTFQAPAADGEFTAIVSVPSS